MQIADNLAQIQARMDEATAAGSSGSLAAVPVTLVAVSKQRSQDAIRAAYAAGVRHFGENRAPELAEKAVALKADCPDIIWHFIGQLQTRQSLPVATYAHTFHAVDRLKIAERLSRQLAEQNRTLQVFLQVNVSGEQSKAGFDCSGWQGGEIGWGEQATQGDALCALVDALTQLPQLEIQGLMTMAPWGIDSAIIDAIFARTQTLGAWLAQSTQIPHWALSMGMTDDFELAIKRGATHIRVGRAIFAT